MRLGSPAKSATDNSGKLPASKITGASTYLAGPCARPSHECGAIKVKNHESKKRFCSNCLKNRDLGHWCYKSTLPNKALHSDRVLFIFYDFETTQGTKCTDTSFEHVPNLECNQLFCAVCEEEPDVEMVCQRCGKRKLSFWLDAVGDIIPYF
jgi:endogenous inhibitor of DNA gyrase (YacG/DUF329 family)